MIFKYMPRVTITPGVCEAERIEELVRRCIEYRYDEVIDLGGMSAKCALLREGKLYGISRCKTAKELSVEETARKLAALVLETVQKCGITMAEVAAVGIGSPGIIRSEERRVGKECL